MRSAARQYRLIFLKRRADLKANPPARVYPLADRPTFHVGCRGGRKTQPGWSFGWFVWDRSHEGQTQVIPFED